MRGEEGRGERGALTGIHLYAQHTEGDTEGDTEGHTEGHTCRHRTVRTKT
jgi:hypothetical protein